MFQYGFSDFYYLYLLAILLWVLFSLIGKFIIKIFKSNFQFPKILFFSLIGICFSFLGLTVGIMTGLSKSPVVGVIIPSILTFYGGLFTYLFIFGKDDSNKDNALSVLVSITSISFFLVLGADYGSDMRGKSEIIETNLKHKQDLEKIEFEHLVKSGKVGLDLPTSDTNKIKEVPTIDKSSKNEEEK